MHNKRLRQQTRQEPISVEDHNTIQIGLGPGIIVEETDAEGAEINDSGGGAHDDNEAAKVFNVPSLRDGQVFGIHPVPGDSKLRDIVQHVFDQELYAGHGLEWEPGAGD